MPKQRDTKARRDEETRSYILGFSSCSFVSLCLRVYPVLMAHTNRLAAETSPYLLQHAHNPVDWYPWGPEAFEAARALNRPIFLSVGYSTCYWCHVMERECFENETIAREMNDRF